MPGRRLGRVARGLRPDRNPLRRTVDRLEAFALGGLLAAVAAGAPCAALAAGHAAYGSALSSRQQQLAGRHEVRAVLTQAAGPAAGYPVSALAPATASWVSPDGVRRSGAVAVEAGTRRGAAVPVWTGPGGLLVSPPLTLAAVAGSADAAEAGAVTGTLVVAALAAAAIRLAANRRRLAAWEADWRVTAPAWNRQRW